MLSTKSYAFQAIYGTLCVFMSLSATFATASLTEPVAATLADPLSRSREVCISELGRLPGRSDAKLLKAACDNVQLMDGCRSAEGAPIFHYDKVGSDPGKGKRIFVMSLIHGDEIASGSVARSWMERLSGLEPRNTWRVIPVANPDGLQKKTRTNARGVDLNRNFPTDDWPKEALGRWETAMKKDPRRYPGPGPASEIETQCYVRHLEDFKPDFIISIHTPLAVLDFDGPKMNFPAFKPLPWISLGNFPGSLGRFMWKDKGVPVLTIELRPGSGGVDKLEQFDQLQDITGTVAIQAGKILESESGKSKKAKPASTAEVSKN